MTAHQYHEGDRLQGVRYRFDPGIEPTTDWQSHSLVLHQLQVRNGVGRSVVIEAPIMAGPIYVHDLWSECSDRYGYAKCHNCGASSKAYRIDRKSRAMHAWAHSHRCPS
jgi:hypothetical protein